MWTSLSKSFGMVFPIVTKLLPNDERLFIPQPPEVQKLLRQPHPQQRCIVDMLCSQIHCLQNAPRWAESELEWLAYHLQAQGRDLDITVDVEAIVFRGQHHTPVVHQGHIKALGMFHLAL